MAPAAGAVEAPAPAVGLGGAALVAPGWVALPGVGGLAAALGIGVPAAGGGGTAVGAHGTAAPPVLPIATASDLRTLAIRYDSTGRRHREFREAVELMDGSETAFSDFAVTGPRTVSWCVRFMVEQGSPRAWPQGWRTYGKLQPTDLGVAIHETCCVMLETFICYDQCNASKLVVGEQLVRNIKLVEEKWKD